MKTKPLHSAAQPPAITPMQRAIGTSKLAFEHDNLQTFYQSGSAKAFLPKTYNQTLEAVLVNTAGGMAEGDQFNHEIDICAKSHVTVTTQTAERVYGAVGTGAATLSVKLNARDASHLHWLPQETILFENARLHRKIEAHLDADSSLMMLEMIVFGRTAMREYLTTGCYNDQWRIYREGQLVHAEAVAMEGDLAGHLGDDASMASHLSMATFVYLAVDAQARCDEAQRHFAAPSPTKPAINPVINSAVSAWHDKLVIRSLALNHAAHKKRFQTFLKSFRQIDNPRVWNL